MKFLTERILRIGRIKARIAQKVYLFFKLQMDIAIGADIGKRYNLHKNTINSYLVTARYNIPYHRSIW